MFNEVPLSVPDISGDEWKYIKECLDTGWVSSAGKYVEKFEDCICEYTGAKYAVACVNGTSALHLALKLVGVLRDDEVIVPTLTFIAPVNAVKYLDAEPIFMDCDEYYNINIEKTLEFLRNHTVFKRGYTYNKITHRRISAIIPVHIFGNAVNLEPLVGVCIERNIKIVEDATESLGTFYNSGKYRGKHTGLIGDVGCLSFNGNKIITTGGGGMIVTNSKSYAEKARYYSTQAKDDEIRYIHNEIGFNYRLTNIQAAMGVAQLERLQHFLQIKKSNYQLYKNIIDSIPGLHLAEAPEYADNNYWMYALQINKTVYGDDKEGLMQTLRDRGIQTRPVWYLNHLQKPYRDNQSFKIVIANQMHQKTFNIPCSANLQRKQIDYVCSELKKGYYDACK